MPMSKTGRRGTLARVGHERLLLCCTLCCCFLGLFIFVFGLFSDSSLNTNARQRSISPKNPNLIRLACQAAQFPELCTTSLSRAKMRMQEDAEEIIKTLIGMCLEETEQSYRQCKKLLQTSSNSNFTTYVGSCLDLLLASQKYLLKCANAPLLPQIKNVEAWISAVITWQSDCDSYFKYLAPSNQTSVTRKGLRVLINMTSNALSMVDALDTYGNHISKWRPPLTERHSSFRPLSCKLSATANEGWNSPFYNYSYRQSGPADVVVSKDNDLWSIRSIQEAVNKAPENTDKRFVIYVKEGVYEETVNIPIGKNNIMLIGDGMEKTVITGSLKVPSLPGNVTTYSSATFAVNADGFIARGITFENRAGPPTKQAVALRVDGDFAAIYDSAILGHQDSLYAHTLRQYYRKCRIEGTVDFIFGNSAAIFEDCTILVRPRQEKFKKRSSNAVTAQGRTDPAQTTGFVFYNCTINGTQQYMHNFYANPNAHKAYLGRPWKMYSRTVFLNSYLGKVINPQGWMPWSGDFALNTLSYGEHGNYGPGSNLTLRVPWSSVISPTNVNMYSKKCFIQSS